MIVLRQTIYNNSELSNDHISREIRYYTMIEFRIHVCAFKKTLWCEVVILYPLLYSIDITT